MCKKKNNVPGGKSNTVAYHSRETTLAAKTASTTTNIQHGSWLSSLVPKITFFNLASKAYLSREIHKG